MALCLKIQLAYSLKNPLIQLFLQTPYPIAQISTLGSYFTAPNSNSGALYHLVAT